MPSARIFSGKGVSIKHTDMLVNGILDTTDQSIEISTAGLGSCGIQISNSGGAWVGTLTFEGTVDGTTWVQIRAVQFGGTLVGGTTVNGMFFAQIGGLLKIRVYATLITSGACAVYLEATAATNAVSLANALPTGENVVGTVALTAGPTFYVPAAPIASGTGLGGPMFIGIQSGATLGRGVMLTTTGHQYTDTVRLLSTGTVNVTTMAALVSITPFRVGGGIVNSGTGTGPLMMGMQLGATLARPIQVSTSGSMIAIAAITANAGRWDASILCTTSAAAGTIIQVSGAHTLYVTDLMVTVGGPMTATIGSETTAKMYLVGLDSGHGVSASLVTPMVCNSNQSLRVICGSSGSCAVFASGYTVT